MWTHKRFRGEVARQRIRDEDGMKCAYCLISFDMLPRKQWTLDHIVCRIDGGTNDPSNLVSCCLSCNSRRADMHLRDFVGIETLVRLVREYPRIAGTVIATLDTHTWLNVTAKVKVS